MGPSNSKSKRCYDMKSSAYYSYVKTTTLARFDICFCVPLLGKLLQTVKWQILTNCYGALEHFLYTSDSKVFKGLFIYRNFLIAIQSFIETFWYHLNGMVVKNNIAKKICPALSMYILWEN